MCTYINTEYWPEHSFNYCHKEFHLERGSVLVIPIVHINIWADSKVNFKKLIWEAYSETSHIFKTELPAKYLQIYIHINPWTYSKEDFCTPMSETYSEFGQIWKKKIFAKIDNAFEYNGVVSRPISKCFPCKIYEVYLTEVIELKFMKCLKLVKHITENVFTFFVIPVVTCVTFCQV